MINTGTKLSAMNKQLKSSSILSFQMTGKPSLLNNLLNQLKNYSSFNWILCKFPLFFLILFLLSRTDSNCYAQKLTGVTPYDTSLIQVHSPRKASLYSAVLPGLGQIYNRKYWKVPIIYGGFIALFYAIIYNNDYYTKFKKAYIFRTDNDPNTNFEFYYGGTYTKLFTDPNELLQAMEYHERYRNLSILGLAGFYVLNIIDATVDAYLFDYDITQDLAFRINPTMINSSNSLNLGISCSLRF
jgi:Family of unknown function (DUF5683)